MAVFQAKKVVDENNEVTDYTDISMISPNSRVPNGYEKMYGVETRFPKATLQEYTWLIEHDQVAEDAYDSKTADMVADRNKAKLIRNNLQTLRDDIEAVTNARNKRIFLNIFRVLRYLLKKEFSE